MVLRNEEHGTLVMARMKGKGCRSLVGDDAYHGGSTLRKTLSILRIGHERYIDRHDTRKTWFTHNRDRGTFRPTRLMAAWIANTPLMSVNMPYINALQMA